MRILPIIILLASLLGQGAVQAAEGPWLDRDIVKMRLISAVEAHEAQSAASGASPMDCDHLGH